MNTTNSKLRTLLGMCAIFAFVGCEYRGPEADEDEPESELNAGETASGLRKGLGGVNGDSDYCNNPAALCDAVAPNEGDCDSNAQCTGGAAPVCGHDNGAKFGSPANFDFCWQTHCENGVQDSGETGIDCGGDCGSCGVCPGTNGDSNFCTTSCPCGVGQGDCDNDAECTAGNICGVNNGALYGFPSNFDFCWPAHCENHALDSALGETGVDCGGQCAPCGAGTAQVLITEVQSDPNGADDAEWIEINNPFAIAVNIGGYTLTDHIATGVADESATRWTFPANTMIAAHDTIVVTRFNLATTNPATGGFFNLFGFNADFEMAQGARNDPAVPNLTPVGGTTLISLSNASTGDAVLLRSGNGTLVSGVEYGSVNRTTVPGTPAQRPSQGRSLHRIANTASSNTSFAVTTTPAPGVFPNP